MAANLQLSLYVAGAAIVALVVLTLFRRSTALQGSVPAWLAGGLVGVVIGLGGALMAMQLMGYEKIGPSETGYGSASPDATPPGVGGAGGGMGGMGGGMGGMGGGMGGMGGGMGGGGGGGSARTLATAVGKLDLLAQGVRIDLTPDQRTNLTKLLAKLDEPAELAEEDAKKHLDAVMAVLTAEQKSAFDAIELPRRRGGGGGGMGGMGGMMGGMMGGGPPTKAPPGASGKTASEKTKDNTPASKTAALGGAASNENPFKQEENAKRLDNLRRRLEGNASPNGE